MLKNQDAATGDSVADEVRVLRERLAALEEAITKIERSAAAPPGNGTQEETSAAARAGRTALSDAAAVVCGFSGTCGP